MIDIKAIRDRAESIRYLSVMVMNKHEVYALCHEIERLRADSARYQWLREQSDVIHRNAKKLVFTHHGLSLPVGTKLYTAPQPAPAQEPTRFDIDMDGSMEPSEFGAWVRYEDI